MCEIQDYSVELKDIYNIKYSVSITKMFQYIKVFDELRKHEILNGQVQRVTCPALFNVIYQFRYYYCKHKPTTLSHI